MGVTVMERDNITGTTEMTFRDEEARSFWQKIVNKSQETELERDGVAYAIAWAKRMEKLLSEGETVASAASKTYYNNTVSGFVISLAYCILCAVWKYGEQLSYWMKSTTTNCSYALS